ncbi:uncharacterized protein KZ484_021083 [Pholidichthys leucotaenia]
MAEGTVDDRLPELKELENKIGRKTPESLVVLMREEDGWRSEEEEEEEEEGGGGHGGIADKICNLKQQVRWLRSADVRILRQLMAVHEGIEEMKWMMEERGPLASRGSSLMGSLSSLTVDEPGASMSPCRETSSPPSLHELPEPSTDLHTANHRSLPEISTNGTPPLSTSISTSTDSTSPDRASVCPPKTVDSDPRARHQDSHRNKIRGDTIRKLLLRSRGNVKNHFAPSGTSTEAHAEQRQTDRTSAVSRTDVEEEQKEELLLGYDAQWSWVESQDDVMFL